MDLYGSSVAISGDTVVVGAFNDDALGFASGSAYVYERSSDGVTDWALVKRLNASDAAAGDRFGAVSIDADTIVVGAPGTIGPFGPGAGTGAAYVFERNLNGVNHGHRQPGGCRNLQSAGRQLQCVGG